MVGNNFFLRTSLSLTSYGLILVTGLLNFSWNISDHDDGHTIGYHVFGRNPELQRIYGEYDSMCDALLGLLPQNYYWVYGAMMISTFVASFFLIFLLKRIALKITEAKKEIVDIAVIVFLLAMPEYLYMSFTFKSVIISLMFILLSFFLLHVPESKYPRVLFVISIIVFGFGVSLRWNHLAFGFIIVMDILFVSWNNHPFRSGLKSVTIWGVGALVSSVIWIFISGYSPSEFMNVVLWGRNYIDTTDFQWIARIGDASLFLLPFTWLSFVVGLWRTAHYKSRNWRLMLLLVASLIPYLVLGLAPSFKYLSMLWPAFFMLFVQALLFIQEKLAERPWVLVSIVGLLLLPWFLGIQINIPTSNWGPGFGVKNSINLDRLNANKLRLVDRFEVGQIKILAASGLALPTSEGMRPLMGHFYALWWGDLKRIDKKMNDESDGIVLQAAENKSVVWVDRINPYFLGSLSKAGYVPDKPWNQHGFYSERTYSNQNDLSIGEFRINNPKNLFTLDTLTKKYRGDTIFALFTYTSVLNKLIDKSKTDTRLTIERLGPLSAKIEFK